MAIIGLTFSLTYWERLGNEATLPNEVTIRLPRGVTIAQHAPARRHVRFIISKPADALG